MSVCRCVLAWWGDIALVLSRTDSYSYSNAWLDQYHTSLLVRCGCSRTESQLDAWLYKARWARMRARALSRTSLSPGYLSKRAHVLLPSACIHVLEMRALVQSKFLHVCRSRARMIVLHVCRSSSRTDVILNLFRRMFVTQWHIAMLGALHVCLQHKHSCAAVQNFHPVVFVGTCFEKKTSVSNLCLLGFGELLLIWSYICCVTDFIEK